MTPNEKARELLNKMFMQLNVKIDNMRIEEAKQCALICVDEILQGYNTKNLIYPKEVSYWQEVKQEIELLKQ